MPSDLHSKPFDEGTKIKLSIFKNYLNEWAPVFFEPKIVRWNRINIFDFFAGPGYDSTNFEGSPVIILNKIRRYFKQINNKKLEVNVILNEKDEKKYNNLIKICDDFKSLPINIITRNLKFSEAFLEFKNLMNNSSNLLFLDQNGIKEINQNIFLEIIKLKTTDFLFFVSSSYLRRFFKIPTMKQYTNIAIETIEKSKYSDIHRIVCQSYKNFIPNNKEYYLTPFTIKKGSNIYGLIFGTNHLLGIEKFLKVCWEKDSLRGEANFDIDEENINSNAPSFFDELNKSSKLKNFEKELQDKIFNFEIKNNKDIILFTLENGFLITHASNLIKDLIKKGTIPKQALKLSQKVYKNSFIIIDIKL